MAGSRIDSEYDLTSLRCSYIEKSLFSKHASYRDESRVLYGAKGPNCVK